LQFRKVHCCCLHGTAVKFQLSTGYSCQISAVYWVQLSNFGCLQGTAVHCSCLHGTAVKFQLSSQCSHPAQLFVHSIQLHSAPRPMQLSVFSVCSTVKLSTAAVYRVSAVKFSCLHSAAIQHSCLYVQYSCIVQQANTVFRANFLYCSTVKLSTAPVYTVSAVKFQLSTRCSHPAQLFVCSTQLHSAPGQCTSLYFLYCSTVKLSIATTWYSCQISAVYTVQPSSTAVCTFNTAA
jgi:hypothetical protein